MNVHFFYNKGVLQVYGFCFLKVLAGCLQLVINHYIKKKKKKDREGREMSLKQDLEENKEKRTHSYIIFSFFRREPP